jgi:ribonuclease P protein component
MPQNFKFSYREKLHADKDFKTVLKRGRRFDGSAVKVIVHQNSLCINRLGLITSRKVGTAVKRNLAKRRLREIFRLNKHRISAGTDIIFILKPQTARLNFDDLQNAVLTLLKKAHAYFDGNVNEKNSAASD